MGILLAAITGALACGGLFFALASLIAVKAFFGGVTGETASILVALAGTAIGLLGGAWIGVRVFRWLAAPGDTGPSL